MKGHTTLGQNTSHVCIITADVSIQTGVTVTFDSSFTYRDPADLTSLSGINIQHDATMQGTLTAKRFQVLKQFLTLT